MSSFIRRIERQVLPSRPSPSRSLDGKGSVKLWINPPREIFYQGRGSQLGVKNPKAADLKARIKREKLREQS